MSGEPGDSEGPGTTCPPPLPREAQDLVGRGLAAEAAARMGTQQDGGCSPAPPAAAWEINGGFGSQGDGGK